LTFKSGLVSFCKSVVRRIKQIWNQSGNDGQPIDSS